MKFLRRLGLALVIVLPLTLVLLCALAVQREAHVPPPLALNTADVVRLKALLLQVDPRRSTIRGVRELSMGQDDLNLVAGHTLNQVRPGGVNVQLMPQVARLQLSLALDPGGQRFWLNVDGRLHQAQGLPVLTELRVGKLPLPSALAPWAARELLRRMKLDAEAQVALSMVKRVQFEPRAVRVSYDWQPDSMDRVKTSLWSVAEQARMQIYNQTLVRQCEGIKEGTEVSLARLLPPLFELAASRMGPGTEEASEYRMLIFTLALHANGLSWGNVLPAARAWPRARPLKLTLGGRDDFAKHFIISAALALEGGGPFSKAMGVYKELDDARDGSGFSFTDIAADLAGTQFGLQLRQDPVRLHARIHVGLRESEFMPVVADLPEFLSESELQRRFGGVGGAGYETLLAQIRARVAALPLAR